MKDQSNDTRNSKCHVVSSRYLCCVCGCVGVLGAAYQQSEKQMKYIIISETRDTSGETTTTHLEIREENFVQAQGVFQTIASRADVIRATLYATDENTDLQVLCTKEELAVALEEMRRANLARAMQPSAGIIR